MKLSKVKLSTKLFASIAATMLAFAMCTAAIAFADDPAEGNCTATIKYYEYADYEDPMNPIDETGRIFIADRVITGLHEGEVIEAWDYVADIPGHFFFDGWPASLTISSDPAENVIELMYFKKWEYEYTVNYYLMVGADLTADNWTDALAPQDVEFIKLGSETFTDQRINKLVKGDAYEYKLDGMYCIDTYPAEIRVGLDADNNVINVLYAPDSVNLPDDLEIPDDVATGTPSEDAPEVILPSDETMDKDDLISLLPDSVQVPTDEASEEVADDFLGADEDEGLEITDEMLENTMDRQEAQDIAAAYQAGYMARTGELPATWMIVALAVGGVAVAILIGLAIAALVKRRKVKNVHQTS